MRINQAEVLQSLLAQEDTDGSRTITIDDSGHKHYTVNGEHGKTLEVKGTYYLANLLQEVWLGNGTLDAEKVFMKPLARVDYLMKNHYWSATASRALRNTGPRPAASQWRSLPQRWTGCQRRPGPGA